MVSDLLYVEMVHKARHSGNLAQDSWQTSILAAFAWSGKYIPLGAALVDWMDGFKGGPEYMARFLLSGQLMKEHISTSQTCVDDATDALAYYRSRNCDRCDGRGVIDQHQVECPWCMGTGRKDLPTGSVYRAYKLIEGVLEQMDASLRHRMKNAPHPPIEATYSLNLNSGDGDIASMGQVTKPCFAGC